MRTCYSKLISVFLLISVLLLPIFFTRAQTSEEERDVLEKELLELEEEISQYEGDITKTQAEKKTLQNEIYILRNKIEKLDLQIYQGNVMIKDLGYQIVDTQSSIEITSLNIDDSKEKLAQLLQLVYEQEQKTMVEILLTEERISDFFDDLQAFEALSHKNKEILQEIRSMKVSLQEQEESLTEEKDDIENTVAIQILQKSSSQTNKEEQENILEETKGKETEYQELLETSKERAVEIRARIFELIGVPEAPTFGEAVEIAKYVENATGIRPAFLLAILTQESNIGKNVGQCYLPKDKAENISRRVMHPTRDVSKFIEITEDLGRDPYDTPISCPMSYGYGGAMGPAQFIPSTWYLYRAKIKKAVGAEPDPWNIQHAFMASGVYLKDLGGETNEWRAAMRYFSGSSWKKYEEFYGNSVIALANRYQKDIEAIEKAQ